MNSAENAIHSIRKSWASRGFSCDLWIDPPGKCWENFTHETDELIIVLKGSVEFEVNGETIRPMVGDELFIPAGAEHSVRNKGGAEAYWLYGYAQKIIYYN